MSNVNYQATENNARKYDELKVDILGILNVARGYISTNELESHYKVLVNKDLPYWEFGFDSTSSLLKSYSSEDVQIRYFGGTLQCKAVENDRLKHITSLIKNTKSVLPKVRDSRKTEQSQVQRIATPLLPPNMKEKIRNLMMSYPAGIKLNDFSNAYARMFGHYLNLGRENFKGIEDLLKSMPDVVAIERRGCNDLIVVRRFTDIAKKVVPGKPSSICNSQKSQSFGRQKEQIKLPEISVSLSLRSDIVKVLHKHPQGIFSYNFLKLFEKEIGSAFPADWQPHKHLLRVMRSTPDVTCIEMRCFYWFFHSGTFQSSAHLNTKEAEAAYMEMIRDFFYNNLFGKPSGMTKEDLLSLYHKTFQEDINLEALSLHGVDNLIAIMKDFITTEYLGAGKVSVKLRNRTDPISNVTLDAKYILGDIELRASYAYENLELPETHSIVISELEKSGSFYFQLYKDEDEINNLMERIQSFYNLNCAYAYKVPDCYLKKGLMCVARFGGKWHRCSVENIFYDEVEVFYVDYGTRKSINKHELRFLRKEFAVPKAYGFKGRLAGVTPDSRNELLTVEAFNFFLDYVSQKTLNSLLYGYDDEGLILINLHYFIPTEDDDFDHIMSFNDVLVQKGYARNVPEPSLDRQMSCKSHERVKKTFSSPQRKTKEIVPQITVPSKNITKYIRMTEDDDIMLININDKPYLASCDFSSFFWDYDIACTVIMDTRGRLKICSSDYPELFSRLMREIPRMQKDDVGRTCLTLFELEFVSEFLELSHSCEKLKLMVQNELDLFSPQDFYWTGDQEIDELMDELNCFSQEIEKSMTPKKELKWQGGERVMQEAWRPNVS